MQKYKPFIAGFAALANLLFVLMIAHSIWRYYSVWDKSGPSQRQYAVIQSEKLDQIRLKHDEEMLNILYYWILPANASVMILSGILLCLYRKNNANQTL